MAIDRARKGAPKRRRQSRHVYTTTNATVTIDGDIGDLLDDFADFLPDAFRSAAAAGARVFYDELLVRAPVGPTGNLKKAIYRWYDKKASTDGRQVYRAGVNVKKAPHWWLVEYGHFRRNKLIRVRPGADVSKYRNKKTGKPLAFVAKDGHTYIPRNKGAGTVNVWVPPTPYLRPSFEAKKNAALQAMRARLAQRIGEFQAQVSP